MQTYKWDVQASTSLKYMGTSCFLSFFFFLPCFSVLKKEGGVVGVRRGGCAGVLIRAEVGQFGTLT